MKRRILALAMAAVMALGMCGCLNEAPTETTTAAPAETTAAAEETTAAEATSDVPVLTSTDPVEMIWSHNAAVTTAGHRAAELFAQKLDEYSNGLIKVTLYPNGELGSVPENDQALKEGTIQIGSGTTGGLADLSLSYFDCPNMVDSNEQALAMLDRDGELFKFTQGVYEKLGIKMVSLLPAGFRETSSNKEVRSFEDLNGLNIRTLENPAAIAYWESWGCNPTPVAFSELYLALQQGLVEAQENAYDTIVASKLHEQQKYIINTHHVIMYAGMYFNNEFWNSLPADVQELIMYVIENDYEPFMYEESIKANDAALQTMKDAGLEVIDFTAEDYAKMREAAKPAYDMIAESVGEEAMNVLYAAQEAAINGGSASTGLEAPALEKPEVTSTDKINMIWSHNAAVTTAGHRAAEVFAEKVAEYTNGNLTVTLYPNGELGSVPENDQALKEGTIQIGSGTTGGLADLKLSYFDCPNMVDSNEQALAMLDRDGELFKFTQGVYESLGIKMVSLLPGGFRETSSNKAVRSFEDLNGLNIRTLENPAAIAYWESWGCNPTPVAFSELYLALQQGLVEAQENAYDTIVASKLHEQQKYIVNTHHVIMYAGMYFNNEFWNSLPADYQDIIMYVIQNDYEPFLYDEQIKANDAALQTMKDAGLEVIDLTAEDYAKMREAAKPAYDMIAESAGEEAMNILYAAQEAALAK